MRKVDGDAVPATARKVGDGAGGCEKSRGS